MSTLLATTPPTSELELIERCNRIEGISFLELSNGLGITVPQSPSQRKGWIGQAIEKALGADAGSNSRPDFSHLNIELKTIPIGKTGLPAETTFITTIPLLTIGNQTFETSQCYAKLKRVLWFSVEGDRDIPFLQRRIGQAILWSPNEHQYDMLKADWNYLTQQIVTGFLETIDARAGEYLQIRPKGANAKSLCFAYDAEGNKIKTLPRGFYLRTHFTQQILNVL